MDSVAPVDGSGTPGTGAGTDANSVAGPADAVVYRVLAERTTDFVAVERSDHTLAYASPSVERLLGYRPDELVGTDARRLVHPDDVESSRAEIGPRLEAGLPFTTEMRLLRKDGTYIWTEVTGMCVVTADGSIERQVSARDISRRKAAEEALRASELLLRAVVDQSTDLTAIIGPDRVLSASRSTVDALGIDLAGMLLHDFWPLLHPDDRAAAIERFRSVWGRPGARVAGEVRLSCRDGWRSFEAVTTNLTHEPSIGGLVLTARDVTDRRRAEQQLIQNERRMHALELQMHAERAAEHMRRAQQMDTVGLLAAGAAHDFGNLLGVVANCAQYVARLLDDQHPARAELEMIDAAVERSADLIQQLLLFGNPPTVIATRFDVGDMTCEALSMVFARCYPLVVVTHDVCAERLEVVADRRRVERGLINVIINACDAMPDGGTVTVRNDRVNVMTRHATDLGVEPGSYARITVRDNGVGMPAAVLERVFEPFFTTSAGKGGTGLGLATAKDAFVRAGGAITLSSRERHGTVVSILLPLAADADRDEE
jgi:PAS domain S-box-containing protein